MMTRKKIARLVVAAAGISGVVWAVACASLPEEQRFTYVGEPDLAPRLSEYLGVLPDGSVAAGPDTYLAKRCASLDCHGQLGRPLRLFSGNGLRSFDANNGGFFPNITGTTITPDEQKLNYEAVIALQPEIMSQVIAGGGTDVNNLLLLRKPRGLERHKGGQIMTNEADEGFLCMASWISGNGVDTVSCTTAAAVP